jgi:mannose-6-phosphate isomerase-like protein (cupin superfamily)
MLNILSIEEYINHPKEEGVFLKHFYSNADNDRLNNLEVKIDPGFQISPHIHENSTEFYYVISGSGQFLNNGEWLSINKGDALKAPMGMEHGIKNTSQEVLRLFSTFSPAIR